MYSRADLTKYGQPPRHPYFLVRHVGDIKFPGRCRRKKGIPIELSVSSLNVASFIFFRIRLFEKGL